MNCLKADSEILRPVRALFRAVAGLLSGPKTGAVRALPGYLPTNRDALWLCEQGFDMTIVGMDSDPRDALLTVESLCARCRTAPSRWLSKARRLRV